MTKITERAASMFRQTLRATPRNEAAGSDELRQNGRPFRTIPREAAVPMRCVPIAL
jgi:hypothetical protein